MSALHTRSTRLKSRWINFLWTLPCPLAVPLGALTLLIAGCGTPVIKVDTSPCNRPELTAPAKTLPLLTEEQAATQKGLTDNHLAVTREFYTLRERHLGLAACVEDNSR